MKNKRYQILTTILVFLITVSCNSKTEEQKAAEAQKQMQSEILNSMEERLAKFMASRLEDPDNYHPMQTMYAPLVSNNALFNPYIYMSAMRLRKSINDYNWNVAEWKKGGKDASYYLDEAKKLLVDEIEPNIRIVSNQVDDIMKTRPEFAGFVIKHTCKVKATNGEMLLKDYEFVIKPDKTLVLYGECNDVTNVALFLDSLVEGKIIINQANLSLE